MRKQKTFPKNSRKKVFILSALIAIFVVCSFFAPIGRYFEIAKNMEIFAAVFKEINNTYVEDVAPNRLLRSGLTSMLKTLDPYTNFISEDEIENFRTANTGQYGGIGAMTRTIDGRMVITMVYEGYPAAFQGVLKIGDEIIKVGEKALSTLSGNEIRQLIRGQVGSVIHLTIKRAGIAKPLEVQLTRQKIKIKNVPYYGIIDHNVGYIQLANFTPKASGEVKNAILAMSKPKLKGIILDLRNNPGGLLLEAVHTSGIFLPKGSEVVRTRGKRKASNITYTTREQPLSLTTPLIILINSKSASASEIVAGSLQDYDRGIIIGQKSFGKGLVQLNVPLPYNSQLKVTTAKYYIPSGRCIQKVNHRRQNHRNTTNPFPDSPKKEFNTTNGRNVYDGGGIYPDIAIPSPKRHAFSKALQDKGMIFDYATRYTLQHPSVPGSKAFSLTDEQYLNFCQWIDDKKHHYLSPIAIEMETLQKIAEHEQRFEKMSKPFATIVKKIGKTNKELALLYKDEIKSLLEKSIVSRYHFEKGVAEYTLANDSVIAKSLALLRDTLAYKKTLNPSK